MKPIHIVNQREFERIRGLLFKYWPDQYVRVEEHDIRWTAPWYDPALPRHLNAPRKVPGSWTVYLTDDQITWLKLKGEL